MQYAEDLNMEDNFQHPTFYNVNKESKLDVITKMLHQVVDIRNSVHLAIKSLASDNDPDFAIDGFRTNMTRTEKAIEALKCFNEQLQDEETIQLLKCIVNGEKDIKYPSCETMKTEPGFKIEGISTEIHSGLGKELRIAKREQALITSNYPSSKENNVSKVIRCFSESNGAKDIEIKPLRTEMSGLDYGLSLRLCNKMTLMMAFNNDSSDEEDLRVEYISVFGGNERDSNVFNDSKYDCFKEVSIQARSALIYFNTNQHHIHEHVTPIVALLTWFCSYSDLFSAPCVCCGKLLARMSPKSMLPPVVREMKSLAPRHLHCSLKQGQMEPILKSI